MFTGTQTSSTCYAVGLILIGASVWLQALEIRSVNRQEVEPGTDVLVELLWFMTGMKSCSNVLETQHKSVFASACFRT